MVAVISAFPLGLYRGLQLIVFLQRVQQQNNYEKSKTVISKHFLFLTYDTAQRGCVLLQAAVFDQLNVGCLTPQYLNFSGIQVDKEPFKVICKFTFSIDFLI